MSINPPPEIVKALHILGIDWPTIDEDELHHLAADVRGFAAGMSGCADLTKATLTNVSTVVTAEAFGALVEHWAELHRNDIQTIVDISGRVAEALDLAGYTVTAVKCAILAYLGVVAAELIAGAFATVASGGTAAAVEAELIIFARREVTTILERIERDVISEILSVTVGGLMQNLQDQINSLVSRVDRAITYDVESAMNSYLPASSGW